MVNICFFFEFNKCIPGKIFLSNPKFTDYIQTKTNLKDTINKTFLVTKF